MGFHIVRNHFYDPVPDTRTLKDELWQKNSSLPGIDMNDEKQVELLSLFASRYKSEYGKFSLDKTSKSHEYFINNIWFGPVDAAILYCMIRHFKPGKVLEVGSGFSSYVAACALKKNKEESSLDSELVAIDPYPNDTLKKGFPGLSRLIWKKIQDVELNEFEELKENDILFIDSSHVVRIGSDVTYLFCEVLPRLKEGVLVHFHDIFIPAEYSKKWVMKEYKFFNEQYMLQAFLMHNDAFRVLLAGNYMYLKYPGKVKEAFSVYERNMRWSLSFWMMRKPN